MYHMLLTISYSDLAYPITLFSRWNQVSTIILEFKYILFTLYLYEQQYITYDKLKTVIFGFTIVFHMFSQVILKLSTMYLDIHH